MRHALGPLGRVLAPASVTPAEWLPSLEHRSPLALAPSSASGWFGGCSLIAFDPIASETLPGCRGPALRSAGEALERAFHAEEPLLAVALLPYSGDARTALYRRGLVRCAEGWRPWGDLAGPFALTAPLAPAPPAGRLVTCVRSDMDRAAFEDAVEAVREAIRCGDVYVLNLTRRLVAETAHSPAELFAALAVTAPASMCAAWLGEDRAVVSCSPERFVRRDGHEVEIAPVKGTRSRGADSAADAALVADLLGSEKERAEHVMVVDLERNDLGRVCEPGSIRVDPLFEVETTTYCHQAVSRVRGLLRTDARIGELLEATFPCGSVTGAPKIAAMRIAEELERTPRGAYTGSLVVAVPGRLDSSVLIRTAEWRDGSVSYGTGCGITVESDPAAEWEESVLKTEPLLGGAPSVALKETCRVVVGRIPLWTYHRERLRAGGCGEAMLAEADRAALTAAAEWANAPTRRARLTLVASSDGSVAVEVSQRLSTLDVPNGPRVARVDVAEQPPVPSGPAKPADRAWWDDAHRRAKALGAQQGVIVGPDGDVLDGSTSAVWIAENGVLVTPPAPPAIPGVSRAFVLDAAEHAGIETRIEPVSWERFEAADEAFLTNAFGGAAPVRGRGGPLFERVAELFAQVWAP